MSGYAYDYSLTPARPAGWRSVLSGFLAATALVAVSTISGAVVTLELLAPSPRVEVGSSATAAVIVPVTPSTQQMSAAQPAPSTTQIHSVDAAAAPTIAPRVMPLQMSDNVSTTAPAAQPPQIAIQMPATVAAARVSAPTTSRPPIVTAPVSATPTGAVAQPMPAIPADAHASAQPADSELTFAKGYAQRQAAQQAANHPAGDKVAAATQLGRAAVKPKPRIARAPAPPQDVAAQDPRLDPRRVQRDAGLNRFDFDRHQALAFGDQRQRTQPAPFGSFFDRLF